ncbi:hypothetical protein AVEN_157997-1 [Araneus ventricosus]|uniref:Uncharacterized protein n=1 Tax=Araneus ventricosus TaxID=182803 RepID=A0A4Y2G852_ARAVE|nr:hypothetical protein AVEN_147574-1 [Araneus ventricosus]GBM49417.1 hypothetical protein AVEN_157997-1 [Araneus ventricosus]
MCECVTSPRPNVKRFFDNHRTSLNPMGPPLPNCEICSYEPESDSEALLQLRYKMCPNEKETTVLSRRKGVDGFSSETSGSGKHPFSPSFDSLSDAWAPTVHKLCHNQPFCGLCDAQFLRLSTVQQQFHVWGSDDSAA